ncbi:acyl-CoA dehydrogenase family protein [Solwaraspora sp. WMMB762]|uniref:acyl-CoA dehydrogenase family protein n=1 Tax=Solwaraspora sp. WMMB762 TaxID=3404120 RepID=UPI003B9345C0
MSRAGTTALSLADALRAVDAARAVITEEAVKADKAAAFPNRSVAALRSAELMSAAIPTRYGGPGFDAVRLSEIGRRLGALCGSTAMIWAMHQIQLGCMEPSADQQPEVADYLRRAAREQLLIASVTSEEGVGGNLRMSKAAVRPVPGGVEIVKRAPTVSYAGAADAFLVTARRDPEAAAGDQVLVLVEARQATLRQTGSWDTLGMRGTCSAPYAISAVVRPWQVLRQPFSEIATQRMVPLSHLLWAAVWSGIADDALRRAIAYTRLKLRKSTAAPDPRVAWTHARGQMIKDSIRQFAADYAADPRGGALGIRANALKMQVSIDALRIAQLALEVCGMAGYSEVGDFSVGRHLRDLYSARLMIHNDRLSGVNAELLTFGDEPV